MAGPVFGCTSYAITALEQLYGHKLARGGIACELHEAKGATADVADLCGDRLGDRKVANACRALV